MEIAFLGGTQTVTGSKFLVHHEGTRVLVDCGLFQGLKSLRLKNWEAFPFNPADIDAVFLTHAHLDHCGALPLLAKGGFRGPIYCTEPTQELTKIILLDSAKIQEEEAEYANRKHFSKHDPALALYTAKDVELVLPLFKPVTLHTEHSIGTLKAQFFGSGHILGASSILVTSSEKSVYFSGDLGRQKDPLMWPPEPPPACDVIVMESTYGNRNHSDIPSKQILKEAIERVVQTRGVLLIPSFSVGRAQNLMQEIVELKEEKSIPDSIPIYFNSPMGAAASKAYFQHCDFHRLSEKEFSKVIEAVTEVKSADESKILNASQERPLIIIAASGMLTGGRVLHHLIAFGGDAKNILLLAGFQAAGTRGRDILEGKKQIKIHGVLRDISCQVVSSNSFSAHADQAELLAWLKSAQKKPEQVFLVHGESEALQELSQKIQTELGLSVEIPELNHIIHL